MPMPNGACVLDIQPQCAGSTLLHLGGCLYDVIDIGFFVVKKYGTAALGPYEWRCIYNGYAGGIAVDGENAESSPILDALR